MATTVTKPGYWFIVGKSGGQNVAGVVKFGAHELGNLPNATTAIFLDPPNVKSLSMSRLQSAVSRYATFLYEIPATGSHTNLQSIGARAVGQGRALYSASSAGVQPTNDIAIAAVAVVAPIAAGVTGASAVGAEVASGGAVAGGEAATGAAAGGGAAAAAAKIASKVASAVTSTTGTSLTKDAAIAAFLALVTTLAFWQRVGEVILGAALLLLGLRAMTTGDTSIKLPK